MSDQSIHIGVLAALVGQFAEGAKDGVRGVKLAVAEFGGQVAGKEIRVTVAETAIMPDVAMVKTMELLDQTKVDYIVGPLSGNEGMVVRNIAKTRKDKTFLNGVAGTQDITLRDPAPNFYNFCPNGAQMMAGLGSYAINGQGYRRVATVGEDYSYPYTQVGAFQLEYEKAGGRILERLWAPVGRQNYDEIIAQIPPEADAILLAMSGTDVLTFVTQYVQSGGTKPFLGGTTAFDLASLVGIEDELAERIAGTVTCSPLAHGNPDERWQTFVTAYRAQFDDALDFPTLYAYGYYLNTKASLLALQAIDADLSDEHAAFQKALSSLTFDGPCGPIRLDHKRQAIATNYVLGIGWDETGNLTQELLETVPDVNSTLGIPEAQYMAIGAFSKHNPPLKGSE